MVHRIKRAPAVRIEHGPTRHTTQREDPVWVRIGSGWCAGVVSALGRREAKIVFLTGAVECHPYSNLRWRKPDLQGADLPRFT